MALLNEITHDEDVPAEEKAACKATYLVKLPHAGQAAQGAQGLPAPGNVKCDQVMNMVLHAVANLEYLDAAAQSRRGPSVLVEQMVAFHSSNHHKLLCAINGSRHLPAKLITVIFLFPLSPKFNVVGR